jgi:hypothetical protein
VSPVKQDLPVLGAVQVNRIDEEESNIAAGSAKTISPKLDDLRSSMAEMVAKPPASTVPQSLRSISGMSVASESVGTPWKDKLIQSPRSPTPQYSCVISTMHVDIPSVYQVTPDFGTPYSCYQIIIRLEHHATHSKHDSSARLPPNQSWTVDRRFSECLKFHQQIRPILPPVLAETFPERSRWTLKWIVNERVLIERRRTQLEQYLNGLAAWWTEMYSDRQLTNIEFGNIPFLAANGTDRPRSQQMEFVLVKEMVERELPLLSPEYELDVKTGEWCRRDGTM